LDRRSLSKPPRSHRNRFSFNPGSVIRLSLKPSPRTSIVQMIVASFRANAMIDTPPPLFRFIIRYRLMKNPGASSWVSSLERKFIILSPAQAGSWVHTPIRRLFYKNSVVVNFPEQAPGYGPRLPIKE
jgi:hypothetical protein